MMFLTLSFTEVNKTLKALIFGVYPKMVKCFPYLDRSLVMIIAVDEEQGTGSLKSQRCKLGSAKGRK